MSSSGSVSATSPPAPSSPRRSVRHKWFPWLVLAGLAAWFTFVAMTSGYHTVFDVLAILLAGLGVSIWYLQCGARPRHVRWAVVGVAWLALAIGGTLFEPVYNGAMGIYDWQFRFATDADKLLDRVVQGEEPVDWKTTPQDYPRFLGTGYWAEVDGVELATDWQSHPPEEMWRREIGAGWSAFAVVGNYALTQEQRGNEELVTCYRVDTGDVVWSHADATRFDPNDFQGGLGGIGPRATPTVHQGKVVTQGGTGIVNCLDAQTGQVLWSHNTAEECGVEVTTWGKSGSPLIVDDMVVVSVGAPSDPAQRDDFDSSLVAYDLETGQTRWAAGNRPASYASPVVADFAGVRQVVMINEGFVTSHRVDDGQVLWEHPWAHEFDTNASASQPIPLDGDRLLLSKGYGTGASLLQIARDDDRWQVEPLWNPPIKRVLKTKFSNVVVRGDKVYGLDSVLLECVDLQTGQVEWKKRRSPKFGYGQVMLVGDTLVVLTESGEVVLAAATHEGYEELAAVQALDPGNVTWNTPAFAPPYLLVRNAREAVCYRLPLAEEPAAAH